MNPAQTAAIETRPGKARLPGKVVLIAWAFLFCAPGLALAADLAVGEAGREAEPHKPISRYFVDPELKELLDTLRQAAHREDLAVFEGAVHERFIASRDFGGVTNDADRGMPNFIRVFGLDQAAASPADGHWGWQTLEYYLASAHLQRSPKGYCAPWQSGEIPLPERSQLCFERSVHGEWQISLLIMAGD